MECMAYCERCEMDRAYCEHGLAVMADGRPVGEQTLTGVHFSTLGTVTTFSWLSADERGRGLGTRCGCRLGQPAHGTWAGSSHSLTDVTPKRIMTIGIVREDGLAGLKSGGMAGPYYAGRVGVA
jgi:hypothetical protein